jgi:hypothetical protein
MTYECWVATEAKTAYRQLRKTQVSNGPLKNIHDMVSVPTY